MNNDDIFQQITDEFIKGLEKGIVPWSSGLINDLPTLPVNLLTRKRYSGVNILLLFLTSCMEGYSNPYWATFKQIQKLGGRIKKGESSTRIIFTDVVIKHIKTNEKISSFDYSRLSEDERNDYCINRFIRFHNVFNFKQTENISIEDLFENIQHDKISNCEDIINDFSDKPNIVFGHFEPCYSPIKDIIKIPDIIYYKEPESYYSTLFHELVHSTGHESRLNRDTLLNTDAAYGSDIYSKEELIAEIGSCFLCAEAGIKNSIIDNSIAYINGWIDVLKNDKKFIVQAASKAQEAFNYIIKKEA